MENVVYTEERNGLTIKIIPDEDPLNPRTEWDHAATMLCWHRRYDALGDKHTFSDPQEALAWLKAEKALYLPLYLYDHSGVTMRTTPFSCQWDSGQVGWIYMLPTEIRDNFSTPAKRIKAITAKIKQQALDLMRAEVSEYDQYLTGSVYGYVIEDEDGNHLDSCWGFFSDYDGYVLDEARRAADALAPGVAAERAAKETHY